MALKIWLPLNKDLRNIGLNNAKASKNSSSVVFQDDATFNKVVYFGTTGTNGSIYLSPEIFTGYTEMSVSFYVNFLTFDADYSNLIGFFNSATASDIYNANKIFSFYKNVEATGTTAQFNFYVNVNNSNNILTNSFSTNTWQHFALVNDDKKIILYQNGVKIGEATFSSNIPYNGIKRVSFGQSNNTSSTRHCNAKMYDLRIYDHALDEKDVKRIYQKKIFDLVPYSGIKNVLFDRSGFMLMPLVNQNAIFKGTALYFNGTNARLRPKKGNVGFNIATATLSIWFTPISKPSDNRLIYIDSTSKMAIGFYNSGNYFLVTCNGSQTVASFSTTGISYGNLNNVIVTYATGDTPSACIVNGVSAVQNGDKSWWAESNGLTIGGRTYNNTSLFNGKIHKVEVFKEQLSVDDAIKLYNEERNMFLPDEYEELEYIESTGTQLIDTQFIMNQLNDIDLELIISNLASIQTVGLFGAQIGQTRALVGYNNQLYACNGQNRMSVIYPTQTLNPYSIKVYWREGTSNSGKISGKINNVVYQETKQNGQFANDTCMIFNIKNGDGSANASMRLYKFSIKENNIYTRYMLPAKRKSDNVIGMYDIVSRQFFTNAGTGSFTGA